MNRIINILKSIRPEADFENSTDFIQDGLLDSYDLVELSTALERSFGIVIDYLKVTEEYFSSVEGIARLIKECGGDVSLWFKEREKCLN